MMGKIQVRQRSVGARPSGCWGALVLLLAACGGGVAAEPQTEPERGAKAAQGADSSDRSVPSARATRVEVAVLHDSDASLQATIPGEIEGSRDAVLASAQGGPVERLPVREGQRVRRGQVVAEVDAALYAIRKRQAETELARARREAERAEGLGSALPTAERERRASQVEMLESNLALAELQLKRSEIRAPFSGVVAELHTEVGEVVAATAPIMRLVRLNPIKVVLSVPDRDLVALSPGAPVEVRVSALPEPFSGEITRVLPTGSRDTRAFVAEVELPNPKGKLKPGMIASAHIDRTLATGSMVIPQDWLVTRRDGVGVFLDKGGVARYVPVKAGRIVRDQVVIAEGLSSGVRLVVTGHRGLADGDALVVAREGRCCTGGRAIFGGR
ncbi:MAG: efflux RND transporter periplasmic adaptor subunit [Myxococcales bacterium]|nr:efflux RND transporter periplasmic adaptor subunit [Myxococcales bacterium]